MLEYWKKRVNYSQVEDKEEKSEFLPLESELHSKPRSPLFVYPLSFILGVALAIVFFTLHSTFVHTSSYERGFHTEIKLLRPLVKVVPTKFTGSLKYKDKHLYVDSPPGEVRYFGTPSEEVDDAWKKILVGLADDRLFEGDIIAPDVLHSLHCLNAVRKLLDSEYYYKKPLESHNRARRVHIDHCLNHIRQILQCNMDLTPVHRFYFEGMNTEVGDFDQVHMCRDYGAFNEYMAKQSVKTPYDLKEHENTNLNERGHREGYIENEESFLPWNTTWPEFE